MRNIKILLLTLFICITWIGSLIAQAERPIAFIHANLIPMTTETVLHDYDVLVHGIQIKSIGPTGTLMIPGDAVVIDCQDAFLMPGLADMHMHIRWNWHKETWPVSPLKLYLANGVTTIRCFGPRGKTGRYALTWRGQIQAGRMQGPMIYSCGPNIRGYLQDPENIVIKQKYQRFDFIKIYSFVTADEYRTIMTTAKKLKFYTAGHLPFQVGLDGVLSAGMEEIAHIEELLWEIADLARNRFFQNEGEWMAYAIGSAFRRLAPLMDVDPYARDKALDEIVAPIVKKLQGKQIPICTTLVVDDVIVQKLFDTDRFLQKPENKYLPAGYLQRFRDGREKHQVQFKDGEVFAPIKYALDLKLLQGLKKAGIPLLLSSDAGTGTMGIVPGFSLHDELKILVDHGFTPYEAISTGTVLASKIVQRMTGQDDFGTISPGKRADLILLQRNPLVDIANSRTVLGVMAAGRWYDRSTLDEMIKIKTK